MFLLLVILVGPELIFASESAQDISAYKNNVVKNIKNPNVGALGFYASLTNNQSPANKTYFDKDENPLLLPKNVYPRKMKKIKKSPKRTIQKIIKKGKNRSRKIYVNPATRLPTISPKKHDVQESKERYSSKNEEITTEVNQRKKPRKSTKFSRNPMPFHKFQMKKDNHNRYRREIERDNVYILKDLDELKFLSKENDYDIIQTHIQKYW